MELRTAVWLISRIRSLSHKKRKERHLFSCSMQVATCSTVILYYWWTIISAVVNVSLSLTTSWSRDSDNITSNDHIAISNVTDSKSGYTASLTYSPITTSDSGLITATVTVSPSDDSMYIQSVIATATDTLCVQGKNPLYNII